MQFQSDHECLLAKGFSWKEKLYAQLSFNVCGITGLIGIMRIDWRWSVAYFLLLFYGVLGIVMRHLICPRCPHLHVYGDCLQLPARWAKWLVRRKKSTPLSTGEKFLFWAIFILIPIYPIYWLISQPILLTIFCAAATAWYLGQWLYFCKRCRVEPCPFNRATATEIVPMQ